MRKEKGPRIFFEVYKEQMKEEPLPEQKPHTSPVEALDETRKVEIVTKAEDNESRVISQESVLKTQDSGLKTQDSFKTWQQRLGLKRDEIYVRQDTLIYAALGAVFLSLGCFFIGHKLGYDKGRRAETVKEVSVGSPNEKALQPITLPVLRQPGKKTEGLLAEQEAVPITVSQTAEGIQFQPSVSEEEKWTLRIISYKAGDQNTKKAAELASIIQKEMDHDAFVAKTPRELIVCVGKFDSRDSSELRALQKALRDFEYENKKQFKGCYPVRLR